MSFDQGDMAGASSPLAVAVRRARQAGDHALAAFVAGPTLAFASTYAGDPERDLERAYTALGWARRSGGEVPVDTKVKRGPSASWLDRAEWVVSLPARDSPRAAVCHARRPACGVMPAQSDCLSFGAGPTEQMVGECAARDSNPGPAG